MSTETLTEWLLRQVSEDEIWAQEASRNRDNPLVPGGEHWLWECGAHDVEVTPDPGAGEYMMHGDDCWNMSLRSRETYPYTWTDREGPSIHISPESELRPAVAGHIIRHDPARVLVECEAKRGAIDAAWDDQVRIEGEWGAGQSAEQMSRKNDNPPVVKWLALPYADRPGYREEWRP